MPQLFKVVGGFFPVCVYGMGGNVCVCTVIERFMKLFTE